MSRHRDRGGDGKGAARRTERWSLCAAFASLLAFVPWSSAAGAPGGLVVDETDRVVGGAVHPLAQGRFDAGRSDPSLPMERMLLTLALRPELDQFLQDLQNPASPSYHHWLTPEEFGQRFGPTDEDLDAVKAWLEGHGFTIGAVARGRATIEFSGTSDQVETAFQTEIHDYKVGGFLRHANATQPTIPRGLAGVVKGVVSLHSFPRSHFHTTVKTLSAARALQPNVSDGSGDSFLGPADFATIYNVKPLYNSGISGAGQTIGIVGRTEIVLSDVEAFRSTFGLPANNPEFLLNGPDPGIVSQGEETEADLDVEWSGAVAPQATVKFVISASTNTTDGVDLSAQDIVDQSLAEVMSTSFGSCEAVMSGTEITFYQNLWAQAAAEGITSFVASGDSGASGCDGGDASTGTGRAVSGLASTPSNVAVGGTLFNDTANPSAYWLEPGQVTVTGTARSYIPEIVWNESGNVPGGSGLWSSGGGASLASTKPSWQSAPGVPNDGARDLPDVSLSAAVHDGYLVAQADAVPAGQGPCCLIVGGTSASSPSFAGLMALVDQATKQKQGNANIFFYQLATNQYANGGLAVFHDVTAGNNSVPGVTGFSAGAGYDQATGLGSVNAQALVSGFEFPNLTISNSTGLEGASGTTLFPFTVTLSRATTSTVVVHYATSNGTALAGVDYVATSGALTFPANTTTGTIQVPVIGSTMFELPKTFYVNLSQPMNAIVTGGRGVGTIQNNNPPPSVSIGNISLTEGNVGLKRFPFTVTLSAVSGAPAIVGYSTQDGTATAALPGHDYVASSGTLTIPAGHLTGTINVNVIGNYVIEPDETFFVNLQNPVQCTIANAQGVGTIVNDDFPGQFQFSATNYTASEFLPYATIMVKRTSGLASGSTVDYLAEDGTAVAGTDYKSAPGHLTFGAGQALASFQVLLLRDTAAGPNRTVLLRLANPQPTAYGAAVGTPSTAVLTLVNGELPGKVQFSPAAYTVNAAAGPASVTVRVLRTGGFASGVTVAYTTNDSTTATQGIDYTLKSGTLTFGTSGLAAELQTFEVPVSQNTGGLKTFTVTLSPPGGGASLGTATATVTILGQLPTVQFKGTGYNVTTLQPSSLITVTRSAPLTGTVTVSYQTADGSAFQPTDYTEKAGFLTFPPGVAARVISVPIAKNPVVEAPISFTVNLQNPTWTLPTNPAPGVPTLGPPTTVTITDPNKQPTVQFLQASYTVNEVTPKAFLLVRRSGDLVGSLTVDYAATGGSAVNGTDYSLSAGTLTFLPSQSILTIPIQMLNNKLASGTVQATIGLSNPVWSPPKPYSGTAVVGAISETTVNILDNDNPTVSFMAPAYSLAESARTVFIGIRRLGGLAGTATVSYDATTGGTARRDTGSGGQYSLNAGTLTFLPNQAVKTFPLTIEADTSADGATTILLSLTSVTGAAFGTPSTSIVTLHDPYKAGKAQFSASDYSIPETAGQATVVVTRTLGTASAATVHYATLDSDARTTAIAGTDYLSTSGTLTFAANQTSLPITIFVNSDGAPDTGVVSVAIGLDTPLGGLVLGSPPTAMLWIVRE